MFKIKESGKNATDLLSFGIYTKEDTKSNILYFYLFGWYWYIQIPQFIKPKIEMRKYSFAEGEYQEHIKKHYGFHIGPEYIHIYHGIQPGRWCRSDPDNSDKSFLWEYPWKYFYQWKYEILDVVTGDVVYCADDTDSNKISSSLNDFSARESAPKIMFSFKDKHDDTTINATCYLERRTFRVAHKRSKIWSFLQWLIKDKVSTTLWCDFDSELGSKKGSWKGGITGMGATVNDGDSLPTAFKKKIEDGGYGYDIKLLGCK